MADRIRPKMERGARAKQFQPFDALRRFREALAQKECEAVPRKELSPEQEEELDFQLRQMQPGDIVTVEYFSEGAYIRTTGAVVRISRADRALEVENARIPFSDIDRLFPTRV